MAKHHPDLVMCRKQPGVAIGKLCEKCDGKCVVCDSFVNPHTLVHVCDECNYGSFSGRCVVCGGVGQSDGMCTTHEYALVAFPFPYFTYPVSVCESMTPKYSITDFLFIYFYMLHSAYYCRECVQQEKDRDGCPKVVNLGATKTDLFYERKKYGFKKR